MKWSSKGRPCSKTRASVEFSAEGKIGKNHECSSAHEVVAGYHFNGSGESAFGGAPDWPVVKAVVSFQHGQEAERSRFALKLMEFIEGYFEPKEKEGIALKDLPSFMAGQKSKTS